MYLTIGACFIEQWYGACIAIKKKLQHCLGTLHGAGHGFEFLHLLIADTLNECLVSSSSQPSLEVQREPVAVTITCIFVTLNEIKILRQTQLCFVYNIGPILGRWDQLNVATLRERDSQTSLNVVERTIFKRRCPIFFISFFSTRQNWFGFIFGHPRIGSLRHEKEIWAKNIQAKFKNAPYLFVLNDSSGSLRHLEWLKS